jgi:hypothetical protein
VRRSQGFGRLLLGSLQHRPHGCRKLAAANLRGTGRIAHDFAWKQLHARLLDGTHVTVRARFAGLAAAGRPRCV